MRRCRAGEAEAKEGVRTEIQLVSRKTGAFPAQLFSRAAPGSVHIRLDIKRPLPT